MGNAANPKLASHDSRPSFQGDTLTQIVTVPLLLSLSLLPNTTNSSLIAHPRESNSETRVGGGERGVPIYTGAVT